MRAPDGTCSWWAQRSHQRLRMLDVETVWRSLLKRAGSVEEARVAWDVFICQYGQEHWRCPCGHPITELFRAITVHVEAP